MPFLDHLEELRWRIIYSLASLIICIGVGFYVTLHFDLVKILAGPITAAAPDTAIVLHASERQVQHHAEHGDDVRPRARGAGHPLPVLAVPRARATPHEKRVAIGVLFSGTALFIAGAALAFLVVVPLALPWLMGFGTEIMLPLITAEEYFGFVFAMVLTFGLSFELPIVVFALAALGLVTPQFLAKYRRHAIVLIVIVGHSSRRATWCGRRSRSPCRSTVSTS